MHRFTRLLLGSALAGMLGPFGAPHAVAQDALGSGNLLGGGSRTGTRVPGSRITGNGDALDASLYMGANGVRDLRNMNAARQDFRIGNLLVTGSVAGDKNFRGDVGYMASSDFRGRVGSDSIFNELQGSALSQIQFVNSPLANDRYSTAMGMGLYEFRRDYTPSEQVYTINQASDINQDRIRLDRTNAYAASRNLYDTSVNASSLRLIEDSSKGALYSVEATPLQGIYTREIDGKTLYSGLSFYERAAIASSVRDGDTSEVGAAFLTPIASIAPEALLDGAIPGAIQSGERTDSRIEGNILTADPDAQMDAYQRVVRELVIRYADDDSVHLDVNPDVLAQVRDEMDEVRELTMGLGLGDFVPPASESTESGDESGSSENSGEDDATEAPVGGATGSFNEASETDQERAARIRAERTERLSRAAEVIRNGGTIDSFSAGQQGRILQLMVRAEERLKAGDFFDAETRFDKVLRINPGNPLALYGRANAQLGAGLYLSAALSLRKLYANYPELIGTDLAPDFLPSETRLRLSISKLNERIERGSDLPSYGLCMAYTGRLLDEPELIRNGFELMDLSEGDRLLAELLGKVWLAGTEDVPPTVPSGS